MLATSDPKWTEVVSALTPLVLAGVGAAVAAWWFFWRRTSGARATITLDAGLKSAGPGRLLVVQVALTNDGTEALRYSDPLWGAGQSMIVCHYATGPVLAATAKDTPRIHWHLLPAVREHIFKPQVNRPVSVAPTETVTDGVAFNLEEGVQAVMVTSYVRTARRRLGRAEESRVFFASTVEPSPNEVD